MVLKEGDQVAQKDEIGFIFVVLLDSSKVDHSIEEQDSA